MLLQHCFVCVFDQSDVHVNFWKPPPCILYCACAPMVQYCVGACRSFTNASTLQHVCAMQSVIEATEVKGLEERCNESVHMPSQSNVGERLVKL
jgi:hypothetical protein